MITKNISGEIIVLSIKGVWKTGQPFAKGWNWATILTPYTKISSKWVKDLNVPPEAVKLLEESISDKLLDFGLGDEFLGLTPKAKWGSRMTSN